jgi:hypothetical protein
MRYIPPANKKLGPSNTPGRYVNPNHWKTGTDPIRRSKYYAYLKHKAQAKYRREDYELTWEEWEEFWEKDWDNRGRSLTSSILIRIDNTQSWSKSNCTITIRQEFKNYYQKGER